MTEKRVPPGTPTPGQPRPNETEPLSALDAYGAPDALSGAEVVERPEARRNGAPAATPKHIATGDSDGITPPSAEQLQWGPFIRRCLVALGAVLALIGTLALGGESGSTLRVSDVSFIVASAIAALSCFRRSRRREEEAKGWRWLGISSLTWCAGALVWAGYGITRDHQYPFPSLADIGFLGYALPAIVGLSALCWRKELQRSRMRAILDGAVIAASSLFISWATVLGPLYDSEVQSGLERAVGLAYPVVDATMVSLVLALGMRRPAGTRLPWLLLGAGFGTLAVTDSAHVYGTLTGGYHNGHVLDAGWTVAFLFIALASAAPGSQVPDPDDPRLSLIQELIPYVPLVGALEVVVLQGPLGPRANPFLFWNGLILVALVGAWQIVMVLEKIRSANALEQRVVERTTELHEQREFLAAVLENLDEAVVACDKRGELTLFNEAARRLHGLPLAPIQPERWADHYGLRRLDGVTPLPLEEVPLMRALRGQPVRNAELIVSPHGRPSRLLLANGRAMLGPDGELLGAVVAMNDVTDRRRSDQELQRLAFQDELTGLGNRAHFNRQLERSLARAAETGGPLSVLVVDLDDAKRVNDSLGHVTGDKLLVEVAERLRGCVPFMDLASRLGGDEFALILEESDEAVAAAAAERVLEVLRQPIYLDGTEIHVTASIGISMSEAGRGIPQELLRAADLAMYMVKKSGKGSYAFFQPGLQVAAVERLTLEVDSRRALRDGEFRVLYQPVVDLSSGAVNGVEALLRWDHPARGRLSPEEFIPLAEESGLILPLGEWVLAEACRQVAAWDSTLPRATGLTMAVNVSLRQLEYPGLAQALEAVLAATGLDAGRVVLEITESAFMDDEIVLNRLLELHRLGVKLSIDDFGTGYSSLARLGLCPVDHVKLDRTFVAEIGAPRTEVRVLRATVAMARDLGIGVIAEGIETVEQVEHLRSLGCDEGQGLLLGQPMDPEDIAQLLTAPPNKFVASLNDLAGWRDGQGRFQAAGRSRIRSPGAPCRAVDRTC